MRKHHNILVAMVLCFSGSALAGESGNDGIGLAVDLGLASSYVWRGWNLFQDESQMDPNMLVAPGLTWSVGDTDISVGYWSAWQLTGPNRSDVVDAGIGAEQDLFVLYAPSITDSVSAVVGLTGYIYPMADELTAGTAMPTYIEPTAGLAWEGPVTTSLSVSYFHGVQDALKGYRNVYVRPGLAWSAGLGDKMSLDLSGGFGYKLFTEIEAPVETNTMDLLLGAALPITIGSGAYVKPSLNVAWTNIDGESFSEGLAPWGAVNVGFSL